MEDAWLLLINQSAHSPTRLKQNHRRERLRVNGRPHPKDAPGFHGSIRDRYIGGLPSWTGRLRIERPYGVFTARGGSREPYP